MSEADILASLDFPAPLHCQAKGHDEGTGGCEPDRDAEYIVETSHCHGPGRHAERTWQRGWVCRGYATWLRGVTNTSAKCPGCGTRTTVGSIVRVRGPIVFTPKNSLH